MPTTTPFSFSDLLDRAVREPGTLSTAYTAFHGYSIGNQLLALFQCHGRGITPGPIATFQGWKSKGRHVKRGEKAITLCMPVTVKRRPDAADAPETDAEVFTRFIHRPNWFVLAQTDGAAYEAPTVATWEKARALDALGITETEFALLDGNTQGYAQARTIAVSPIAALPLKTLFHELAHIVLGHTAETAMTDDERTPRSLREVEAEAVAMVCCAALDLPGVDHCRGYIQHWNRDGQPIPERSAARIFKAADSILRAGRPDVTTENPVLVERKPDHSA